MAGVVRASAMKDEEEIVQTLCAIPSCFVFKIPPRMSAQGHRAADWKEQVWTGRLVVQGIKRPGGEERCFIKLISQNGATFAVCPYKDKGSVEKVTDSSRYYCLRIENAAGKRAFIGLGFKDRAEAFDFNVALQDFEKHKSGEDEIIKGGIRDANYKPKDYSLKQGQTITVNIKKKSAAGKTSSSKRSTAAGEGGGLSLSAPPPGGSRARRGRQSKAAASGKKNSAPSPSKTKSKSKPAVGTSTWESF